MPSDTSPTTSRSFLISGHVITAPTIAPGLYLVATPIGNLADITLRALETIAGCNAVYCEDTRVTRKLLDRYGIKTPLSPYHEHNAAMARPKILQRLAQGESVALVSDAGTPLISDPGFKLVRETTAASQPALAIPGPSSILAALSVAALPTDRFFFEGFLPAKTAARRARITEIARIDATLVLFESGPRLAECLHDLAQILGTRDIAICRELTKLHEEIRRAPLHLLTQSAHELETRGEFVLVIGPPPPDTAQMSESELDNLLRDSLARGSVKDAVAHGVELSGRPRREVYARALALSNQGPERDG
ncbi:MAG: 16S rRNA (cytidine(1402)-2'-O)-methyltransferase [Xanthobacteraceae bacterium]|nr:16S rRNA (cytidine(1402)-2'-O)-methyltransferase [Xanthobacteraceae bacterium]